MATETTRFNATITDVSGSVGYGVPVSKELAPAQSVSKEVARRKSKGEDLAYGEPVYWATVIGSIVVIIGGILAFCSQANFVATSYWISSVWDGQSADEIWAGAGYAEPQGHWYLSHLATGDGLQCLGMAVSFVAITVGLLAAGIFLLKKKSKVFATFAFVACIIMCVSIFGLIPE